MSIEQWRKNLQQRRLTRRRLVKEVAIATAAIVLFGCAENPKQPDTRFVTDAQWDQDIQGRKAIQRNNELLAGVQLTLQGENAPGLRQIDLTVSPYKGSKADGTFSPGGYPILALESVQLQGGKLVPAEENSRVQITDLGNNLVDVRFTIPMDQPSNTIPQNALPVGEQVGLYVDIHGIEKIKGSDGKYHMVKVSQLNVASSTPFIRHAT